MQLLTVKLLIVGLLLTSFFCNHAISINERSKLLENNDTIYIKNDLLIIEDKGKRYELENIVNLNNTTISRSSNKNIFYLTYHYSASINKSKHIVKVQWTNERLRLLKEASVSYNSKSKVDYAWVIFYHNKEYLDNEELGGLINYELKKGLRCTHQIQVFSKLNKFNEEICPKSSRKIPGFYQDGTLIGHYQYDEKIDNDLYLDFDLDKNLQFKASVEIKNKLPLNDIGYFLEQNGHFHEASVLLEAIIRNFPQHTVAYINLGDAYWGLKDTPKAKTAYQKYIDLMKKSGKEAKIPKRILERVKYTN